MKILHCPSDTPLFLSNGTKLYPDPRCASLYNKPVHNIKNLCPAWLQKNSLHHTKKNEDIKKRVLYYECKINEFGQPVTIENCPLIRQSNKNAFIYINSFENLLKNDKKFNENEFHLNDLKKNQMGKFKDAKITRDFYTLCTTGKEGTEQSVYKFDGVCRAARKKKYPKKYFDSFSDLLEENRNKS